VKRQIVCVDTPDALEVAAKRTRTARVRDLPAVGLLGGYVALCSNGRARCIGCMVGVYGSKWVGELEDELSVIVVDVVPLEVEVALGSTEFYQPTEGELTALRTEYSRAIQRIEAAL
jgi:hypothetical protein